MSASSSSYVQCVAISYANVAINYNLARVHQAMRAAHRINAYRIHYTYHSHEVVPDMSASSNSHVQCVAISYTNVAINYNLARVHQAMQAAHRTNAYRIDYTYH